MYSIGLDIGSSSIKVAIVKITTGECMISLQEPSIEMEIHAPKKGWAEQDPATWWEYTCKAIKRALKETQIPPKDIQSIGIAYQMHGLVLVDHKGAVLRNSIIWCDSRAVTIGHKAYEDLGTQKCMNQLLNAPGNFTASKLKWVKDNEPDVYNAIHKYMLPGDYIAYKLSGTIHTTKNGLSEGILWDYKNHTIADVLLEQYGIAKDLTPTITENFTLQSKVNAEASEATGLPVDTPITYRAGDQPNNALSLGVFESGQAALTGGTSGVIYAVTEQSTFKEIQRVNQFAHANYSFETPTIGRLLNINGAGIQYRWLLNNTKASSYEEMNTKAATIPIGSDGIILLPFGNGAERMFHNRIIGTHIKNLDLNRHQDAHLYRAGLEGIAFSFVYGMELLKEDHTQIHTLRAGNDNLFRSEIFGTTIATLLGKPIEIYNTTGAVGAARAANLKDYDFTFFSKQIVSNDHIMTYPPSQDISPYQKAYQHWKKELEHTLNNN
ncbi:carbohydrate kinase [Dokdonia pacifica]|uniref:Xylulokinase n=1 Tax=Dokdonia pacifica TaxID=1627892 RepID=A0A239DQX6_9FLAO|nr:FGGY family carbohydrate kinase [Dokdonia pacifica]GGG40894.1 carbohydrate kinase [Dokdonia pacifica]SNS34916.1 xylulokinase [Dokdonia pacifica]